MDKARQQDKVHKHSVVHDYISLFVLSLWNLRELACLELLLKGSILDMSKGTVTTRTPFFLNFHPVYCEHLMNAFTLLLMTK